MLKLCAGFSKKVPVDGIDFSSRQYSAELEVEVADATPAEAIQQRLRTLYSTLEDVVNAKIHDGESPGPLPRAPQDAAAGESRPSASSNGAGEQCAPGSGSARKPVRQEPARGNGRQGTNGHASAAQQRAVLAIGRSLGMTPAELARLLQDRYGTTDPARLSREDASALIDLLKSRQSEPAEAR